MVSTPRYWDTDKGKVLYAIFRSQNRTWKEIQQLSGYNELELRIILKELFDLEIISKSGSSYWIEDYDLYCEYRNYEENLSSSNLQKQELQSKLEALKTKWGPIISYLKENQFENSIVANVLSWSMTQDVPFDPKAEHFFLFRDKLDQISKTLIENCTSECIIINPFVDQCSLSDRLKEASINGKTITLMTRSPKSERNSHTRTSRKKYHEALAQCGVNIQYNDRIHSKIILSDNECGVVSSMNFKSESSSGKNLEAGIVTWQNDTIKSLIAYAETLQKDHETSRFE
ncbi:MAG: phospholipase D-like domain-containing protein [Candidatus Hodarchaeales archaeon]